MYKKFCLLPVLAIAAIHLCAQKLPATLLWRISGNGLQKPSYLYGTMHLTDERLFNLGDSLYSAIEHCDGFATEIDPAEFTPMVIDEAKSYLRSARLKDIMHDEAFRKYGKKLAKKLNKNEDDITTADVLKEKNSWIHESYSTGRMQTFLDVYLYDIARRQGKWTGGVEDLKDQEGLIDVVDESDIEELAMDDNDKETKKNNDASGEYFINAYIKNDLNEIDRLSYGGDSVYEDALLIKRNKKMTMRMDSLSRVRTMVFAVGAAHLPDEKGVIALLKQRGFTVTPVFSAKKIKPTDYKVAEVPLPWYDVKDEAGLYTASMPGKAGDMTLYGMITMKIFFDAFSSTIYMTTALKTPYSEKIADSILGNVAAYYFGVHDYTKGKPVVINNVPGREFISAKQNYSHGYLLFKDATMYMVIAMSMKKDSAAAPSINRFLHSFSIQENKPADNTGYYTYANNIKAYRVDLPAQPKPANDLIPGSKDSTMNREISIATDPATGAYFFIGTNEAAPGYFIENDSTNFDAIRQSQKTKFATIDADTMYLQNGARILRIEGIMAQAPLKLKAYYQSRGNRWYALVAMYDTSKPNAQVERFFSSFTALDYAATAWNNYTSADTLFSAWAPESFQYKITASPYSDTIYRYDAFDSAEANSYGVLVSGLGNYYWQTGDSVLWEKLLKNNTENANTVLLEKPVSNGDANGYELETQEKGSTNIKRKRFLLNGGKLYTLITLQTASEINSAHTNKFFESFRFNSIQPNSNLFTSKAAVLLHDISSADSAMRDKAVESLSTAPFTQADLPLLHAAILKDYPVDDEFGDYDRAREKLKDIIINLKDSSSYSFAKNNYANAGDSTKNFLLAIMASFKTAGKYDDLQSILLKQPPHINPGYHLLRAFSDTLQLTAGIMPGLLPLLKDTAMAPVIVEVTNKLLDSGLMDKNVLQPYQQDIMQLAQKHYAAAKTDPGNYDGSGYQLIRLLGKINTTGSNGILQQWSLVKSLYTQMDAVAVLLKNKQPVNPVAIQALAKDNSTRTEIYDSLKAYKKEQLFPTQYRTQKYFAESYVYAAGSDDNDPAAIIYLSQKTINFKDRPARFYFYKIMYGDADDASYSLACAGPFHLNAADVSSDDAAGDVYYDEDYDADNLSAQMDALISQMEDWYTWKDKK